MSALSVLVVDDEEAIRLVLRELLSGLGYSVVTATGADQAVQMLKTVTPDVVLTDIIMPEGEGIELIQAISRMETAPPVIAMSGNPTGSSFLKAAEIFGAVTTLEKPFTPDELRKALDKAVRK
jgi:CheY-like chemotaxis protein